MYKMKMPAMPKVPTWGWVLIALVVVYYVFMREGVDSTLKDQPKVTKPKPTMA